jgi:hypothetical protein
MKKDPTQRLLKMLDGRWVPRSQIASDLTPAFRASYQDGHIKVMMNSGPYGGLAAFTAAESVITREATGYYSMVSCTLSDKGKIDLARMIVGQPEVYVSADFRVVKWYGTEYRFTPNQALIFQRLWEDRQRGGSGLNTKALLNDIEQCRVADVFRDKKEENGMHRAWKKLIGSFRKPKGIYRLIEPNRR